MKSKAKNTHNLTEEEAKQLTVVRQVVSLLNALNESLPYLISLVEKDSQRIVDEKVRKRLKLGKSKGSKADLYIDLNNKTVKKVKDKENDQKSDGNSR